MPHEIGPRWGIVSTVKAPLRKIAQFVAYHLDLGCDSIHIYLDDPDPQTAATISRLRGVRVFQCDAAYWDGKKERTRQTHQLRQAFNATRAYRRSNLDWLAHIDVDEYLILPRPMHEILRDVPPDAPFVRLPPAEMLAQDDPWQGPAHFKLSRKQARISKARLNDIYPEFGAYVPQGFISYTGGKNIARVGMKDIRLGIHAVLCNGEKLGGGYTPPGAFVGHAHAPDWETFSRHLKFRLSHGSYRNKNQDNMKLQDVLEVVQAHSGNTGLRRFFDEMCLASPRLLERLAAHDMLVTARLDLDEKLARWYGSLPAPETGRVA